MTHDTLSEAGALTVNTLSEALPFIQRYDKKTIVIKYGGHAMADISLAKGFARDVVLLKHMGVNPVIVHGGGPQIGDALKRLNVTSKFEDGLRVTDAATMEIVEMVLSGSINKTIVRAINMAGGNAVGLSGADSNLILAEKATKTRKDPDSNIEKILDLGFVGEPKHVDPTILETLASQNTDFIPVVAPVGFGLEGESYNINADTAAGAIASALKAERLLLLTDVKGVLDSDKNLIRELDQEMATQLILSGAISGGMIPKIETALTAVKNGVKASVILDGRTPHALLTELFTDHGAGTLIS
ncbi:acetylglutamate kinase [Hirschia baltica]|uniref:Acetylglutamate kinase n=1 Tax=Hirschia baltica (strain ATCC 49814 / DSM 5838 / IFAM 1418) TaxID=582402 RepID=C6XQ52_HIRBI|nr:acetylglutamate kinase [Hirschia baltica]ACT58569.1 acetylglutamate kinase [Hirschia baltica ATCC 49814]